MDILKRIDHAQQFCKFYADGAYSVEKEKWNYHVTPKFIEDIRQYIESLQLQTQQAAQRKWAGLTNEEIAEILCDDRWQMRPELMLLACQAKLKERNT